MPEETVQQCEDKLNKCLSKLLRGIRPPENLTVAQWADKNRRLTSESAAELGRWRTSRTPYMVEILNCFTDPLVEHIVVVAPAQVGKSELLNNMIGYCIDQDPGPILLVQPTLDDVKRYSETRIAPMIRATRCLRDKVSDPKARDSGNTKRQKAFPGGTLIMAGSNAPHDLCSMPIRYLFGDERDRWATSAGSEGDPWELATARTRTFYNRKMVEVSTPTIKSASAIERSYNTGTMEHWVTECPHCHDYSEICLNDIRDDHKWEEKDGMKILTISNVNYICPKCGCFSSENTMKYQPSKWIAAAPDALKQHKTRSFWLTAWVSPWADWKSIMRQFYQAQGDTAKMQVVYNTQLGQLWENRGDMESEEDVMARREVYEAELPDGVLVLTCGVDTQDDRLEYEVVGHGHFGETWGIRHGVIMGRPDTDAVWERFDDVINRKYKFKNGVSLKVTLTFIDEGGHFTQEVRMRCRERQGRQVFAIKGAERDNIPFTSPPKKQRIVVDGRFLGTVWVYEIGVNAGKQKIADNLRVKSPGVHFCHFPRRDDYGKNYFDQLMSEHFTYSKTKNKFVWEKLPGHERNEAFDIRNYNLAAFAALDPDLDAIEQRIRNALPDTDSEETARAAVPKKTVKKPRKRPVDNMFNDW